MINYTVKAILWTHGTNTEGENPIYIQITIDRKTSYISTSHYTKSRFWNEKTQSLREGHNLPENINIELTHRKNEITKTILKMQVEGKDISAKMIKAIFSGKNLNNIFNFIESYCEEVRHKKSDDTIAVYEKHQRKLLKFNGSANLNFEELTPSFLQRYEKYLRESGAKNNYVHAIWKTLKTFFNAAIKKKIIKYYPFDEYENPIYKDPKKDYLTIGELKKMEDYADTTENMVHKQTAVYFLFGCYSGLRISDWKLFDINSNVEDGKIKLRAKKNAEWVTVPICAHLARSLERMKTLPLTIEEPTINEKIKIIAKEIGINKKLSSHCARKTFAVTMCADLGVSSESCATMLGITVDVCVRNYYEVTDIKIRDEVLRAWSGL